MRQGCRAAGRAVKGGGLAKCRELQRLYVHMEHLPLEG